MTPSTATAATTGWQAAQATSCYKGRSGNDDPGFDVGPMVRGLYGGSGGDLFIGGSGNDSIGDPGPGAFDEIYCGQGRVFVEASAIDCETVE